MDNIYKLLEGPIVICDDELDILDIYEGVLEQMGVTKIKRFTSAVDALDSLAGEKVCLVISDYRMPNMTGVDFCTAMKARQPDLYFVLSTAFADRNTAMESINQGVNYILEKPVNFDLFKKIIKQELDRQTAKIQEELAEMESVRAIFFDETRAILGEIPDLCVQLEERAGDPLIVDVIFRKMHTLKGGSGTMRGAEKMQNLSHVLENLLGDLRSHKIELDKNIIDVLLTGTEYLKAFFGHLERNEVCPLELIQQIDDVITSVQQIINQAKSADGTNVQMVSIKKPMVASEGSEEDEKDQGVFVSNEKLDKFLNLSGELIVLKNSVKTLQDLKKDTEGEAMIAKRLQAASMKLEKMTDNLQELIMEVRKVKVRDALKGLPRLVRNLGRDLGKDIKIVGDGFDLGVDKNIATVLNQCMNHMIRNSMDHGFESSAERLSAGRKGQGQISITVKELSGVVKVQVRDDGRGIDPNRISQKAMEKGLVSQAQVNNMSKEEVLDLLFLPGFSTAEKVSNISGRGVGMDFVKTEILKLNGKVFIESELGKGTNISMDIPVPKSITIEKCLIASGNNTVLGIPQNCINQVIATRDLAYTEMNGRNVIQFQGATVPLFTMTDFAEIEDVQTIKKSDAVVVVSYKRDKIGLVVDKIDGQLEVVIRPFGGVIDRINGFKGAAILGDDRIAYVLDPEEAMDMFVTTNLAA